MKVQSVQPTPNPNAFKFLLEGRVIASGVKNYTGAADAGGDDVARRLFEVDGVDTLFFCDNFITVSMVAEADWRAVHDAVVEILEQHARPVSADTPGAAAGDAAPTATVVQGDGETLAKINDLLDDRVRPYLASDGGGLEVLALEGKTLHIRYQGACGSCPSSIAGTLHAIQNLIQTEIDEELQVVSA